MLSAVQVKVHLLFSKRFNRNLAKLSTNILREVCGYLQDLLYPCINDSKLTLWN